MMFKVIILSCATLAIFILGIHQFDFVGKNIMLFEAYKGNTFLFFVFFYCSRYRWIQSLGEFSGSQTGWNPK